MEMIVDLSLFSEFFYSTFLRIDKFLFSSFNVKTSFADNTDQTIVYILAFILVCGLLGLLSSDRKERKINSKIYRQKYREYKVKDENRGC